MLPAVLPAVLLVQQAEWLENTCTGICLVSIILSIIVGKCTGRAAKQGLDWSCVKQD